MSTKSKRKVGGRPSYYQLELIQKTGLNVPLSAQLEIRADELVVQGTIENHIIVSVPDTISIAASNRLFESLSKAFKQPVLVVTNNVQFLSARKLAAHEERLLFRHMEAQNGQADPDSAKKEKVDSDGAPNSNGGGSGVGDDGDIDPGKKTGAKAEAVGFEGDKNIKA